MFSLNKNVKPVLALRHIFPEKNLKILLLHLK